MLKHFGTFGQSIKTVLIVVGTLVLSPLAASLWIVTCDHLMQNATLDPEENLKISILAYALWISLLVPYFSETKISKKMMTLVMATPCLLATAYGVVSYETKDIYLVMIWPIAAWAYFRIRALEDWYRFSAWVREKVKLRKVRVGIALYIGWLTFLVCVACAVDYYDDVVYVMIAPLPLLGLWAFNVLAKWIRAGE